MEKSIHDLIRELEKKKILANKNFSEQNRREKKGLPVLVTSKTWLERKSKIEAEIHELKLKR